MTPFATTVYKLLLRQARNHEPSITYAMLAARVRPEPVHPRSPKLHAALGEISLACRHEGLPCLPAMVWRSDTQRPSSGYYKVAHPRAQTEASQRSAWQREHDSVVRALASYPPKL
jgi:hypothetical protein